MLIPDSQIPDSGVSEAIITSTMASSRVPSVGFALDVDERERSNYTRTLNVVPKSTELADHLRRAESGISHESELIHVIEALERCFVDIARLLRHGARSLEGVESSLSTMMCPTGGLGEQTREQSWQHEVLRLDKRVTKSLVEALRGTRTCTVALASREGVLDWGDESRHNQANGEYTVLQPAPKATHDTCSHHNLANPDTTTPKAITPTPERRRRYAVVLDHPLGHALNVDTEACAGTIFGIYRANGDDQRPSTHVLRCGSEMLVAGYALYGSATQLVLSTGNGVDGFTLHPNKQAFMLTRPRILIPKLGRFYSVNLGHRSQWSASVANHLDEVGTSKSLRYMGTFVADVHRTLLHGGAFYDPPSRKRQAGQLRLVYEVAPVAFLMKQAGGSCTSGWKDLLDIVPSSLNQCIPVALGSEDDVDAYTAVMTESSQIGSPLLSPNPSLHDGGIFRRRSSGQSSTLASPKSSTHGGSTLQPLVLPVTVVHEVSKGLLGLGREKPHAAAGRIPPRTRKHTPLQHDVRARKHTPPHNDVADLELRWRKQLRVSPPQTSHAASAPPVAVEKDAAAATPITAHTYGRPTMLSVSVESPSSQMGQHMIYGQQLDMGFPIAPPLLPQPMIQPCYQPVYLPEARPQCAPPECPFVIPNSPTGSPAS